MFIISFLGLLAFERLLTAAVETLRNPQSPHAVKPASWIGPERNWISQTPHD